MNKVRTYNRVYAEQTEEDLEIYTEQNKIVSKFGKYVRDNDVPRIGVMKPSRTAEPEVEEIDICATAERAEEYEDCRFAGTDWSLAGQRSV